MTNTFTHLLSHVDIYTVLTTESHTMQEAQLSGSAKQLVSNPFKNIVAYKQFYFLHILYQVPFMLQISVCENHMHSVIYLRLW